MHNGGKSSENKGISAHICSIQRYTPIQVSYILTLVCQDSVDMITESLLIILQFTTLLLSLSLVKGSCNIKQYCDDPREVLDSIKLYSDNHQQLLNAFHPINEAKPASVILAYFTNYTDQLPPECSQGTYPWKTYPTLNYTYQKLQWCMWTTSSIYSIQSKISYLEFGVYLPTMTYYLLFNKTSPFVLPTPIACIKTAYTTDRVVLGDVSVQVNTFITIIKLSSFLSIGIVCSTSLIFSL